MKIKRGLTIVSLSVLVLFSISLISAGLFSDIFNGITGKVTATCVDSDANSDYPTGLDYNTSGRYGTSIYYDFCPNSKQVREIYCNAVGSVTAKLYDCPYACLNGACVPEPPPAPVVEPTTNVTNATSSNQTTNGSNLPNVAGPSASVSLTPGDGGGGAASCTTTSTGVKLTGPAWIGGSVEFTDKCIDSITGTDKLIDYSCNGDDYESNTIDCPYGCPSGAHSCTAAPPSYTCSGDLCTGSETCPGSNWLHIGTKCCAEACVPGTAPPPATPSVVTCGQDCSAIRPADQFCSIGAWGVWGRRYECETNGNSRYAGQCIVKAVFAQELRNCESEGLRCSPLSSGSFGCVNKLPNTYACVWNTECASGKCGGGVCGGLAKGKGCLFNSACASNKCEWFTCR